MGDETSQTFQSCRLKRGLFTPKHIAPSQTRGRLARAHANVPMAAPKGAIQAESQRAAAAAQPLCSWRFFGSGAEITSPIQNTENRFAPPLMNVADFFSMAKGLDRVLFTRYRDCLGMEDHTP